MPTELYLDTARMGLMTPTAQRMQIDFVRLAGEEAGSIYFDDLLIHGADAWPRHMRRRYSALTEWKGIDHLKQGIKSLAGAAPDTQVLLANRSAQLMKLAAELLFRTCRNVLITDLTWPGYRRILERRARHTDARMTILPLRRLILRDGVDSTSVVAHISGRFAASKCDGLFLPAIDNLGIRLPLGPTLRDIRRRREVRFIAIDGAQAYWHAPLDHLDECDFFIAGSHKWLGGFNPMAFALHGHARSRRYIETTFRQMLTSGRLDDPLLKFLQQWETFRWSSFGETVNVAPLFSTQGALFDALPFFELLPDFFSCRVENKNRLGEVAQSCGWALVSPSPDLSSGICLLQSAEQRQRTPDVLRSRLREAAIAATVYPHGLVRLSMPRTDWSEHDLDILSGVLRRGALSQFAVD